MPDDVEGFGEPENLDVPPPFFPKELGGEGREAVSYGELVDVAIRGVYSFHNGSDTSHFVLLSDGRRELHIMIGPFEAQSISLALEGSRPDRPLSHDLIKAILDRMGLEVDRIVIDDLWNAIYYAKIYVRRGKVEAEIDSRPSDAIALAVRCEAPIYVAEGLLEPTSEG